MTTSWQLLVRRDMQNNRDETLARAYDLVETKDLSGLPPEVQEKFESLMSHGIPDDTIKKVLLLTAVMNESSEKAADIAKELGFDNEALVHGFLTANATEILNDYKDDFDSPATYGALMLTLGILFGIEWTERRHA